MVSVQGLGGGSIKIPWSVYVNKDVECIQCIICSTPRQQLLENDPAKSLW